MKRLMVIILFTLVLVSLSALEMHETYFKFNISSKSELKKLSKIISIDNVKGNTVFAYANDDELQKFISLGYSYTKLQNPSLAFKPKMAFSKDEMRDWDSYPTYETYVDMMYQFAEDYPSICTVQSMGTSVDGRELLFAKISDNVQIEEDEPTFFYTAQMHGDEIVTFVTMLHLIDYLCSNYQSDPQVTNLVNNLQIWINPLSNPDGTYHGGNNTVWGATRYNANNIDLNRNFPDPEDGDHPDGNAYQPENIIMMNFAESHNIVMSANFHSGAEVVNYPWDTWERLHPDNDWFYFISREYADTVHEHAPNGYMDYLDNGITNGFAWYRVTGGRQDYMNYFRHCREVTIELSDEKLLPENQLLNHWNYNKESLLKYMEQSLYGIKGHITDENGNPLQAKVTILSHDSDNSWIYSNSTFGSYYRPIKAGTYTIQFSKEGYGTQIFENVTIDDYSTYELDVTLPSTSVFVDIHGVVADFDTGAPIEGAIISLLDTSYNPVTTNQNGQYTIEHVPIGSYTFSVQATGYTSIVQINNVTEQNTEFNFYLHVSTAESFEDDSFPSGWSFAGNADWTIATDQFYDGLHSAKSGDINDGESSVLLFSTTITENGEVSFYYKVSSEANYDKLKFYIDNTQMGEWSGESQWTQVSFPISAGSHILKWAYIKDTSVTNGEDCAWIDMVDLPSNGQPHLEYSPSGFNVELPENTTSTDTLYLINSGTAPLLYSITINQDTKNINPEKNIEGSYMDCEESSFYTGIPVILHFNIHFTSDDGEWLKYVYLYFPEEMNIDSNSISDFSVTGGNSLPFQSIAGNNMITWGNGSAYLENGDVASCSLTLSTLVLYEEDLVINYRLVGDNWGTGIHQVEGEINLTNEGPAITWIILSNYSGEIAAGDTTDIELQFNSGNLDFGTYEATIVITDNAGNTNEIPLQLNVVQVSQNDDILPSDKPVLGNYPNPFNPTTTIYFTLNNNLKNTKIQIYNLKGQKIKTLTDFTKDKNRYYTIWDGIDKNGKKTGSGIYFYRLINNDKTIKTKKMIMLK